MPMSRDQITAGVQPTPSNHDGFNTTAASVASAHPCQVPNYQCDDSTVVTHSIATLQPIFDRLRALEAAVGIATNGNSSADPILSGFDDDTSLHNFEASALGSDSMRQSSIDPNWADEFMTDYHNGSELSFDLNPSIIETDTDGVYSGLNTTAGEGNVTDGGFGNSAIPPSSSPGPAVNSPHTRLTCPHVGCGVSTTRQTDLRRHMRKHGRPQHDCPVAGCDRKGMKGFFRSDKLVEHQRKKHRINV
jgi:hypothetical protein